MLLQLMTTEVFLHRLFLKLLGELHDLLFGHLYVERVLLLEFHDLLSKSVVLFLQLTVLEVLLFQLHFQVFYPL